MIWSIIAVDEVAPMLLVSAVRKGVGLLTLVADVGPSSPYNVMVTVVEAVVRAAKPVTSTPVPLRTQLRVAPVTAVSPVVEQPLHTVEV